MAWEGSPSLTTKPSINARPILIVDDEQAMATAIKDDLEERGYLARTLPIAEAVDMMRGGDAAMLILDRILFGEDSLGSLEALRKEGIKVPVLLISALSSIDQRVQGLRSGGDDYLAKPFEMVELAARVEALLRRLDGARATSLRVGDLEMDLIEKTAHCGDMKLDLMPREFELLEYFLRHPDQVITRKMLLENVWQYHFSLETNVVDVHIGNLRRKIDVQGRPSRIASIRRMGFMLRANA
jgi:two-component system OmpR family response regulator